MGWRNLYYESKERSMPNKWQEDAHQENGLKIISFKGWPINKIRLVQASTTHFTSLGTLRGR